MNLPWTTCAALVLAAGSAASAQTPQDHAFSYQGLLKDNGTPANGMYDIQLRAFGAASGGVQSGPTVEVQDVSVADGVFTARVDFGIGVFNGERRWLEVGFRPGSSTGAYTLQTTRTEINSAPYAACAVYPWLPATGSVSYDGNVAIGTATPIEKLTVRTTTADYGVLHTDGTVEVGSWAGFFSGITAGWYGTRTNHPLSFFTNNGSAAMTIQTDGAVGIGTVSPLSSTKLHVIGDGSDAFPLAVAYNSGIATGNAILGQVMPGASGDRTVGVMGINSVPAGPSGGYGVFGEHWSNGTGVRGATRTGRGVEGIASDVGGVGGFFFAQPGSVALEVGQGLTRVKTLQILGGADVAEPFDVAAAAGVEPRPGMVVVIDAANAGALRVASDAYDARVAGVISGANGLDAGMVLRAPGTAADGDHPVAMTGRVWCYVDASFGAIRPGDRLTTSTTPGHAMKAADAGRSDGAVIGKAMTALDDGRGLVLVLVNLQ